MDTSNDFYINDISAAVTNALKPVAEIQQIVEKAMEPVNVLLKQISRIISEIAEMVSIIVKTYQSAIDRNIFELIHTISLVASEICVDDVAPRAPPLQSFKEKIKIRFLYYMVKYEERIYSMCEKILENEFYTFARAIFIYLLRLFFGF